MTEDQRPPTEAEEAKVQAEAAKAQAEAEVAKIEARTKEADSALVTAKLTAEVLQAQADAAKAQSEAAVYEIQRAREERIERTVLADNKFHHVYQFVGAVGGTSVKECIDQLTVWMRNDPGCDIEIIFNSPGGDVVNGLAMWDFLQSLRRAGHKLTTTTYGYAASMAGILLQAGEVRVMGRESWLMIHEASFGVGGKMGEVEDQVKWVARVQERILDIFAARSNLTKAQLRTKWRRTDWWISSDEALELGLVDVLR